MAQRKILFIAQEITPYLPDTALSQLGRKVAQGVQENGFEVRTFMPKFGMINERRNQLHEVIRLSGMNIIIDDNDHPLIIKVATLQPTRMQIYFIDNEDYFRRPPVKELETASSVEDNDERAIFYTRGVIETVKKLRWEPAVIQCMGWLSALAPLYIKELYNDDPSFRNSKIVFAIQDDPFEGTLDPRMMEKLIADKLPADALKFFGDAPVDYLTLNKLAIDNADAVVQINPDAAPELVRYAEASGKPFMRYKSEDSLVADIAAFYHSLID